MSESVNVGTLEALLRVVYDPSGLAAFDKQLDNVKVKSQGQEKETNKLIASFSKLAASLDPVVAKQLKYQQNVDVLNRSLKAELITQQQYNILLTKTQSQLQETTHWTQRLGSEIGGSLKSQITSLINPATLAVAAVTALAATAVKFVKDVVTASIEAETSQKKVADAVERAGSRSGVTVSQINDLADSYSHLTGKDDEVIADAEALALKYNRISSEILPRLTRASLDMAQVQGIDIPAAMAKSAGYVNLPLQALTKLRKEGYAVADSQSQLVKDLIRSNDILGAQKVILSILEEQYGGASIAARDSLGGALEALGTTWENFLEKVGEDRLGPLRQGVELLIDLIETATRFVDNLAQGFVSLDSTAKMAIYHTADAALVLVEILAKAGKAIPGLGDLEAKVADMRDSLIGAAGVQANQVAQMELLVKKGLMPQFVLDQYLESMGAINNSTHRLAGETGGLTEAEERLKDAMSAVADEISNLEKKYSDQIKLRKAAIQGTEALTRERDTQAAQSVILSLQNKLKKEGIALSQQQIDRITQAVIGQKEEERLLNAIIKAQSKIGTLSIEYLTTVEKIDIELKKDLYTYQLWEKTTKEALDTINKFLPKLDFVGKGLKNIFDPRVSTDLLSKIVSLTEKATTAEYKRAKAIAESIELMKIAVSLGVLSPEQAANVNRSVAIENANPLFTPAEQELYDFAAGVLDSFRTVNDDANEYMTQVERAVDAGFLSVAQGEAEIARVREGLLTHYLSQWGSFFDTLGGMFGGIFNQISAAINNIQRAQQAGQQFGGLMQSAGLMGSQMAGAMGYMGATIAIMYEVYKAVDAQIKKNKARKWGDESSISVVGGEWSSPSYFSERGKEIDKALRDTIDSILDSLGAVLKDLPQITIRARRDGKEFSAYVAGVWIGTFKDAQTAVEEGVRAAITQANFAALSTEMSTVLKASLNATLEELERNIATGERARQARLGGVGSQYFDLSDSWIREMEAAKRLGLSIEDMIAQRKEETDAIKNSVLGIDTSMADKLRDITSLNRGMAEAATTARAVAQQQIDLINQQIAAERARTERARQQTGEGSGGPDSPGGLSYDYSTANEALDRLMESLEDWTRQLNEIPESLTLEELDMGIFDTLFNRIKDNQELSSKYAEEARKYAKLKAEAEIEALRLQLIATGRWEEFAQMFEDVAGFIRSTAGEDIGRGGRGSGRGSGGTRSDAMDFLRDRSWDLALSTLGEYARRQKEITKEYDEQIKAAGKDAKLRAELIALRDKELAQLAQEQAQKTNQSFQSFLGLVTPFDQVRETASKLIKEIEDSPYGDARKARMIGRVMAEVDKQIEKLSRQVAAGLLGEMLGDMQQFGATEEQMHNARVAMAVLEHTLKLEHYRAEIEILKAQGKLAPEIIAALDDAFHFLESIDPRDFVPGGGNNGGGRGNYDWIRNPQTFQGYADNVASGIDTISDSLREAQDLLTRYTDDAMNPWLKAQRDFNREWALIFAQFGQGPEIMSVYSDSLDRLREQFNEPLQDMYDQITQGAFGGVSIESQYQQALANFEALSSAVRGGDLSQSQAYRDQSENLLELLSHIGGSSAGGAYSDLRDRIRGELQTVLGINPTVTNGGLSANGPSASNSSAQQIVGALNTSGSAQVRRIGDVVTAVNRLADVIQNQRPSRGGRGINWGDDSNQTPGTIGTIRG